MNTTSTLSIATLVLAGLFTTGCSQQQVEGSGASQVAGSSQQVAGSSQQQAEPVAAAVESTPTPPKPPVAHRDPNSHTHPAQPNCTNSVTHSHPNGSKPHHHKYSCSGMKRPAGNRWTHRHAAIPNCTDSVTHTHKYSNRNHHHKYSCKGARKGGGGSVNVHALQRKLKAKGYYKGPINGVVTPQTRSALQRYMQNR